MKTYHSVSQTITTKYYGPTNTKSSRIKATAEAGSIWVSWDYALNAADNHAAAIEEYIKRKEWDVEELYVGQTKTGAVGVLMR